MNMLKRGDTQYDEIENFADYELTQCIAYEMAIRNPKNKESMDYIIDYYYKHKIEIGNCILNRTNGEYRIFDIGAYPLSQLDMRVLMIDFLNEGYQDKRFSPIFLEILEKVDYLKENKEIFDKVSLDDEEEYLEATTISQHIGYKIKTSFTGIIQEELPITKKYTFDDVKKMLLRRREGFGVPPEGQRKVIEMFKRPKLDLYPLDTKDTILEVNLSRPLNEIIAYITHIKNDMEKNDLLKAPIEIFGIELEKADNLVCNAKGKCFDPRSILSKQQKMADMFYIYDCLNLGYSQTKIRNTIYNYYQDKGLESITLDPATLRKYKSIGVEYIENERYKEMITGIKM